MPNSSLDTAEIAVVFFKLIEGNFDHWALWIHGSGSNKLFQVAGDYAEMEAQVLDEDPRDNSPFYQRMAVDDVLPTDVDALEACILDVPVQNDVALWDCQDYIPDLLDALETESFLGGGRRYARIRRLLSTFRGPADETRHLIEQYTPTGLDTGSDAQFPMLQHKCTRANGEPVIAKAFLSAEYVVDSDDDS